MKEAEKRTNDVKSQLKSNEQYQHISYLEDQLNGLKEEVATVNQTVIELKKEYDDERIRQSVDSTLQEIRKLANS